MGGAVGGGAREIYIGRVGTAQAQVRVILPPLLQLPHGHKQQQSTVYILGLLRMSEVSHLNTYFKSTNLLFAIREYLSTIYNILISM